MSKFDKNARYNLPVLGVRGRVAATQALVLDITESVPDFPVYTLRWIDDAGEPRTGTVGEGDLNDANASIEINLGVIEPIDARSFDIVVPRKRTRKPAKKKAASKRKR